MTGGFRGYSNGDGDARHAARSSHRVRAERRDGPGGGGGGEDEF